MFTSRFDLTGHRMWRGVGDEAKRVCLDLENLDQWNQEVLGRMTDHRQVHIVSPDGSQAADIDEDIIELVEACWCAGLTTLFSCQDVFRDAFPGRPRMVQLAFPTWSVEDFLSAAAGLYDPDPDSLYTRALDGAGGERAWNVHFSAYDYADAGEPHTDIRVSVFIQFPFDDVAEVVRRLRFRAEHST